MNPINSFILTDITKNFINGVIGPVGTYTKSMSGSGNAAVMTLRHQGSATEYKELIINEMLSSSLKMIESIDKLIRCSGLENTQEFIEWQDTINAISVK